MIRSITGDHPIRQGPYDLHWLDVLHTSFVLNSFCFKSECDRRSQSTSSLVICFSVAGWFIFIPCLTIRLFFFSFQTKLKQGACKRRKVGPNRLTHVHIARSHQPEPVLHSAFRFCCVQQIVVSCCVSLFEIGVERLLVVCPVIRVVVNHPRFSLFSSFLLVFNR